MNPTDKTKLLFLLCRLLELAPDMPIEKRFTYLATLGICKEILTGEKASTADLLAGTTEVI